MPFKKGETPPGAKPFGPDNPPPGKGRPKGSKNRATVFKQLLKLKTKVADPADPKHNQIEVDLYHAAALGQIMSAMKGNTRAWQEIQDSIHGPLKQEIEHSGPGGGPIQKRVIFEVIDGDGAGDNQDEPGV